MKPGDSSDDTEPGVNESRAGEDAGGGAGSGASGAHGSTTDGAAASRSATTSAPGDSLNPSTGPILSRRSKAPTVGTSALDLARALANPVGLRGIAALLAGSAVLLMPTLTVGLLQVLVVLTLVGSTTLDFVFALTGRSRFGARTSRLLVLLRGLASLGFLVFVVFEISLLRDGGRLSVELLIGLAGIYVAIRGAIVLAAALLRWRTTTHRGVRIAGAVAAMALGVLATVTTAALIDAVIVGAAVVSMLLGVVLIAWSIRRADGGDTTVEAGDATVASILWDWIRGSDIGRDHRATAAEGLYFEEPERYSKLGAWWVMLVLSVAIATYAVLADSTAVVIGAMLVAPLMVPILGLAGALVNGWSRRAAHSTLTVALGVIVAILLSYGLAAWAPVAVAMDTNSQIVSRISPNTVDMLIAVAAGAAGAFATVDKRVSSSIAGVAIAVALVPPLAVVGVSLANDSADKAFGAFLLFLTNFVAIVLAASAVFVLTGFARHKVLRRDPWGVIGTIAPYAALAAVILVPLMFTSQGLVATSSDQRDAQMIVDEWLGEDTDLLLQAVTVGDGEVSVLLTGSDEVPDTAALQTELRAELRRNVAVRIVITPVEVIELPASGG